MPTGLTPARPSSGTSLRRVAAIPLAFVVLASGVALAGVVVLNRRFGVRFGDLTRDPSIVMSGPLSYGVLSTAGGLLWSAATAVCVLARLHLGRTSAGRFFAASAAFTAWLMLDDVFLLHEKALPVYLGVPETAFHVAYPMICLAWLAAFRRRILATRRLTLAVALAFFTASEGMDALLKWDTDAFFLFEDGAKFVGIVAWLAYFVDAALAAFRDAAATVVYGNLPD
ncbi:MAG TPA: hypothetical protein VEI02_03640 [Planctomycetota bacterium]|nr:hypothetical protein [Planctomycetota bacterium]